MNEQYVAVRELVTDLSCEPDLESSVQMSGDPNTTRKDEVQLLPCWFRV